MFIRNWLNLGRKLVDTFDMQDSFTAVQTDLNLYAQSMFGAGVLNTSAYPNPFMVTPSPSTLGGAVGYGTAFNQAGNLTAINANTTNSPNFTCGASDPNNARFDLVCIQYASVGDTLVPQPSDPLNSIYLNFHDDFNLIVIQGTPSSAPVYPTTSYPTLIPLFGFQIPAGATTGLQCTVDYTQRQLNTANSALYPAFQQEVPAGAINGTNTLYTLSQRPINNTSVLVRVDGRTLVVGDDYSILNQAVTVSVALKPGQGIGAYYLVQSQNSQNPLAGMQEVPTGTPDGTRTVFTLSGLPANQTSTIVFVDGLVVPTSEWNLVQGQTNGAIMFKSGSIPAPGQVPYVFYLANPFIFGVLPPQSVTTTAGGLKPYGSQSSPQIIPAGAGIFSTMDERQLWVTKSAGGAVQITANPQISPGATVGQELVIQGVSDTDYIIFEDGNGLILNGELRLTTHISALVIWNGVTWKEQSRA